MPRDTRYPSTTLLLLRTSQILVSVSNALLSFNALHKLVFIYPFVVAMSCMLYILVSTLSFLLGSLNPAVTAWIDMFAVLMWAAAVGVTGAYNGSKILLTTTLLEMVFFVPTAAIALVVANAKVQPGVEEADEYADCFHCGGQSGGVSEELRVPPRARMW